MAALIVNVTLSELANESMNGQAINDAVVIDRIRQQTTFLTVLLHTFIGPLSSV